MNYENMSDEQLLAEYNKLNISTNTPMPSTNTPMPSTNTPFDTMSDDELFAEYNKLVSGTQTTDILKVQEAPANIIQSEEFTGTLAPGEPKLARAGTIREFNDPAQQLIIGAMKGGDVAINALEAIDSPVEIINDPLRVVDYVKPFANAAIAATEWATQAISDVTTSVAGVDDIDIKFPRIEGEFGKYPERQDPLNKKLEAASKKRKALIKSYEDTFRKKYNATPIITEVTSMAPDFLTIGAGAVMNIPKYAAFVEGILGGARAETEGTDIGTGKVTGTIGGYVGTKAVNAFMNNLTPREMANINMIAKSDELKADNITLLKFYQDNPNFSPQLLAQGKTGNPVIDNIVTRQREQLGDRIFNEYIDTLNSVGGKSRKAIEEVAEEFRQGSEELYTKMKDNSDAAWDQLGQQLTVTDTVSGSKLASEVQEVLAKAPDNIRTFANKLLNPDKYKLEITDIINRKKELHADYIASKEIASDTEAKSLRERYTRDIKALDEELALTRGMEAEGRLNLTAENLIDMIKNLNNKKYVAGGNIDLKNKVQKQSLAQLKEVLERNLGEIPNVSTVQDLYNNAKAASKDIYDTFGYSSGKNMGKKVYNSELGNILEEEVPGQIKLVEHMVNDTPAVFSSKIKGLENKLSKNTIDGLKQVYLEQRIKAASIVQENSTKAPRISSETFDASVAPLLDTADGRKLISDQYGETVLENLSLVRTLNRELGRAASDKEIPTQTFKAWTAGLPNTLKTIMLQKTSDYLYVRRMLQGYGEEVKFDWARFLTEHIGYRAAGATAGAILAPEGYEVEGAAVGGWAGKYSSFAKLISQSPKTQDLVKSLKTKIGTKIKNLDDSIQNDMAKRAGGGLPDMEGFKTVNFPNKNYGAILDNMDGTISLDLNGIKDTGKGYGTKLVEQAIRENPNKKIFVDTDMRGNSPSFFKKMKEKYPEKFIFEDESMLRTIGGLSIVAATLGMSTEGKADEVEKVTKIPKDEGLYNNIHSMIKSGSYDSITKIYSMHSKYNKQTVDAYIAYDIYKILQSKDYNKLSEYSEKTGIPMRDLEPLMKHSK